MRRYSHQFTTGISFGLTTAVITSLGMVVGLYSATSSKLVVVAALVIMAIADGLSDALSLHAAEEAELEKGRAKHSAKEIWLTTLFVFLSVCGFTLTFTIPILVFDRRTAIFVAIGWGFLLLILVNLYIARIRKENPGRLVIEHILLAILVVIISYFAGDLTARAFQ